MAHVTVIPIMLIITFFQCKTLFSSSLASEQQGVGDAPELHNTVWISKHEPAVILSWNNNLTKEETEKYTVKYILSYKFFNTTHENEERLQKKKKRINLNLHSGFNAKVKTQLFAKETDDVIKESGWTAFTYKAPPVYIQNFSCIIYNISFFNCTWYIKAEAPEDIQIFFSYRHIGKDFDCQQYIKNARKKNIGCHMKEIYFQPSRKINLNITVRGMKNNSRLSYYKIFTPQTIEKLNPPINISVSLENRSIQIHWKPPPTIGSASSKCFLYEVKITDRKIVNVTGEKYEYPFHKPARKCAAQVRVKKEKCIRNKIWSEWSEPVLIDHEKTVDVILLSLTLFCLLIFLGGLLIRACRRYQCLEVITMPVPHPSDNIKTWLAADDTTRYWNQMSVQREMYSDATMGTPEENRDENIQQQKCLKESGLEGL
ncbi:interleukin-5 receptor subunit alpha-like isoform X1 [Pezoporus flaviventris]|uniref:interleukin-5 receptor subunit alpha-like isoform X1 n=1 Tax=Pezoporus flaviventris TaxID=889875 RepID=UPI002AB1D5C6|nr:interleukin-5 receptor subunit alpha-like isoform X1 [Pezoporus flaviventris]